MKRQIARWMTWWMRLFILCVFLRRVPDWPGWVEWAVVLGFFGLAMVRAPADPDREPVTGSGPVGGAQQPGNEGAQPRNPRQSWFSLAYLFLLEGVVREFGGARFILGNHVIVDHGDGVHSLYAHLRRSSVRVAVGDDVRTGQILGEVGNSGNTSEPHLHMQLMDDAAITAAGRRAVPLVGHRDRPRRCRRSRHARGVPTRRGPSGQR